MKFGGWGDSGDILVFGTPNLARKSDSCPGWYVIKMGEANPGGRGCSLPTRLVCCAHWSSRRGS